MNPQTERDGIPHIVTISLVALVGVLTLTFGLFAGQSVRAGTGNGGGTFIVRCFYNGKTAPNDPIMSSRTTPNPDTAHLHDFFGNVAAGGSTFPGMIAGESHQVGSMENNGSTPQSNCQDSKDTAGYWMPTPFIETAQQHPGGGGGGCSTQVCDTTHLYQRDYYIAGSHTTPEIPDGTIMVTGFPSGCTDKTNIGGATQAPPGCVNGVPGYGPTEPAIPQYVQYSCGASTGNKTVTPASAWPYNCSVFWDNDDTYHDGVIARVLFPNCEETPLVPSFIPPNDPNGTLVPGYVAPWIPYTAQTPRPTNDFAYPNPTTGACPAGYTTKVVSLEERLHILNNGNGWTGKPSNCQGAEGTDWNTARVGNTGNAENSPTSTDTDGDADSTVDVSGNGTAWGFHKCVTATTPGAVTLSFACGPNDDLTVCNTSTGTAKDSGVRGCVTPTGICYYGDETPNGSGAGMGWETFHADYWQTWQEGGGNDVANEKQGTFPDLVNDVYGSDPDNSACGQLFVRDDPGVTLPQPDCVYGSPSPNPAL